MKHGYLVFPCEKNFWYKDKKVQVGKNWYRKTDRESPDVTKLASGKSKAKCMKRGGDV